MFSIQCIFLLDIPHHQQKIREFSHAYHHIRIIVKWHPGKRQIVEYSK